MAVVMTTAGQRTALIALIQSVPGTGVVHNRRRVIRDENAVKTLLVKPGTDRVNAWMVYPSPASTTVTQRHPGHHGKGIKGGGNVHTTFQWMIDFYHQIDDATESEVKAFDLAWAVADEINAYGQLDIAGIVHQNPADVEQFGFIMVANFALYHYARIGVAFEGKTRPT